MFKTTPMVVGVLILAMVARAGDPPVPVEIAEKDKVVTIKWNQKVAMEYVTEPSPFKPYARQLCTPSGINVVRDQVADHIHHHGLMFAWKVDGANFWEETKAAGTQASRKSTLSPRTLAQDVEWVGGGEKKDVLLVEKRKITFGAPADAGANVITWQATFSTPPGKESATITGSHYHGLGMRFAKAMDNQGPFIRANGKDGEVVRGVETLYSTAWCAYTAAIDGKPVTVAMFDGPGNPKPATFFTMHKPFAYLSATLKYHKEPLVIQKDKPFTLTYGVAVWDGKVERAQIEALYQTWLKR